MQWDPTSNGHEYPKVTAGINYVNTNQIQHQFPNPLHRRAKVSPMSKGTTWIDG